MGLLILPVRRDTPAFDYTIELDRVVYALRFRYNFRMQRWIFDVAKKDGTVLAGGIVILPNVNLLGRFRNKDLPRGEFYSIDQTGKNRAPALEDLGSTIQLIYVEADTVL